MPKVEINADGRYVLVETAGGDVERLIVRTHQLWEAVKVDGKLAAGTGFTTELQEPDE